MKTTSESSDAINASEPSADASEHRLRLRLESVFEDARSEILGTLFYLVKSHEDARDAMQETFLKCWRRRDQIEQVENLKAWVFRIALNTGRDFRKAAWNRRRREFAEETEMASTTESPDARLLKDEQLRTLSNAVMSLRENEREVFLLRQNGQLTYEEIAQATGLPLGTVKTRMRTAIRCLRVSIGEPK